jgi:hypothetical protein
VKRIALAWCSAAIAGAAILVAGCSGGGGGGAPGTPAALLTAAPGPASTAFKQSVQAIVSFPRGTPPGAKRDYVSPNSTSISVTLETVNGGPVPPGTPSQVIANLAFSGAGQNCTVSDGLATCTITIPAPPGNVIYRIATYAVVTPAPTTTPVGATPTPVGSPIIPTILDEAEEGIAIKQGVTNTVSVTLEGIVKFATVTAESPLLPGQASTSVLKLTAMDASGAVITGTKPFVGPFTLQDADKYGPNNTSLYKYSTFLADNGGTPAKIIQIFAPTDVITLSDGGISQPQFFIKAAGPGQLGSGAVTGSSTITPELAPIVLPGIPLDDAAHGGLPTDPNYNQPTLFLQVGAAPYTITPSEVGFTNAPYRFCTLGPNPNQPVSDYTCLPVENVANVYAPCNNSVPQVAVFNPGPPMGQTTGYTYTITAKQAGLCLQQFFDGNYPGHEPPPIGNPLVNGELWVKVQ